MSTPLVSIITATYNWRSVLRYAIRSVLEQTEQDFEMIVVGDGCTDDSEYVVRSFKDRRLSWHNLPENTGSQSAPNNFGLALARGQYVAYLGHDDLWHPNHLALLVDALQTSEADFAHSLCLMLGPPGSNIRTLTGLFPKGTYESGRGIPPSSLMHRRGVEVDIGGWKDYRTIALPPDVEFCTRAFDMGKRFVSVHELSVFKFNSALRPNSYREQPCHEQAAYDERMRTEPDFLYRELLATVRINALDLPRHYPPVPDAPTPLPLGWYVDQWRKTRGLQPLPELHVTKNEAGV